MCVRYTGLIGDEGRGGIAGSGKHESGEDKAVEMVGRIGKASQIR